MTPISRRATALLITSIAWSLPAGAQEASLHLVDLSESGSALSFEQAGLGSAGSARNPVRVRLTGDADRDLLDFEVRGARAGEELHFSVLAPPANAAPSLSSGNFQWSAVEGARLGEGELRFEVTAPRERFVVRLVPRAEPLGLDAPYYTVGRFGEYMAGILTEPLAQVTQIGTSLQGRPLYRILVDDPTLPSPKKTVLMVVRQHGDEFGSSYLLEGFLDLLLDRKPGSTLERLAGTAARAKDLRRVRWIIYPLMNPDGAALNQRYNANGVDLNRNWERSGCSPAQEPETFAIQCDLESLDALYDVDIGGDHHGWRNGSHGGFRYAPQTWPSNVTLPEYQEARKDTLVMRRHDPTQENWQENGGTVGMCRVEMFLLANFLLHTPEYDSFLSSPEEFRAKGRAWAHAMVDTLFAPRFTDDQGKGLRTARVGDGIHVTVDDDDENVSPAATDTVQVTVFDPLGGDIEVLTLAELARGGLFRNVTPLQLSGGAVVPGNGELEVSSGARIRVRYVDDDYGRDESYADLRIR